MRLDQQNQGRACKVKGLVIPVQWDRQGRVVAVAIHGFDETETLVAPTPEAQGLLALPQRRVTAWGVVSQTEGGKRVMRLDKYRVAAQRGGKELVALLACGVLMGAAAPAALAEPAASPPDKPAVQQAQPAAQAQQPAAKADMAKAKAKRAVKADAGVKRVQLALAKAGYKLKADGMMGKRTKAALKSFQKKNGLKATGKADEATRAKLGLS